MSRARWKPSFIHSSIRRDLQNTQTDIVCTQRSTPIVPEFVGRRIHINNGIRFVPISITEEIVGYRAGEFVSTRKRPVPPSTKQSKPGVKTTKKIS